MNDTGTNALINAANTVANAIQSSASSSTGKDWATWVALVIGPVIAIVIAEILRRIEDTRKRKIHVFRTLMATRSVPLNYNHVEAVNLIELEFYKAGNVMDCWQQYRNHLDDQAYRTRDIAGWENDRNKSLVELIYEISKVLRYSYNKSQIQKGVYYPQAFVDIEKQNIELRQLLLEVLKGRQIHMMAEVYTRETPKPPEAPPSGEVPVQKPD